MRTNVVLDDRLVAKAMKMLGAKTKREAIDRALRALVEGTEAELARKARYRAACRGLLDLQGSGWEGDRQEIRRDRDLTIAEDPR